MHPHKQPALPPSYTIRELTAICPVETEAPADIRRPSPIACFALERCRRIDCSFQHPEGRFYDLELRLRQLHLSPLYALQIIQPQRATPAPRLPRPHLEPLPRPSQIQPALPPPEAAPAPRQRVPRRPRRPTAAGTTPKPVPQPDPFRPATSTALSRTSTTQTATTTTATTPPKTTTPPRTTTPPKTTNPPKTTTPPTTPLKTATTTLKTATPRTASPSNNPPPPPPRASTPPPPPPPPPRDRIASTPPPPPPPPSRDRIASPPPPPPPRPAFSPTPSPAPTPPLRRTVHWDNSIVPTTRGREADSPPRASSTAKTTAESAPTGGAPTPTTSPTAAHQWRSEAVYEIDDPNGIVKRHKITGDELRDLLYELLHMDMHYYDDPKALEKSYNDGLYKHDDPLTYERLYKMGTRNTEGNEGWTEDKAVCNMFDPPLVLVAEKGFQLTGPRRRPKRPSPVASRTRSHIPGGGKKQDEKNESKSKLLQ